MFAKPFYRHNITVQNGRITRMCSVILQNRFEISLHAIVNFVIANGTFWLGDAFDSVHNALYIQQDALNSLQDASDSLQDALDSL